MKDCPKCAGELKAGPVTKEEDGSEYFELTCLRCGQRFLDAKIPTSAFLNRLPEPIDEPIS